MFVATVCLVLVVCVAMAAVAIFVTSFETPLPWYFTYQWLFNILFIFIGLFVSNQHYIHFLVIIYILRSLQ